MTKLKVAKERFFNNGKLLLPSLVDAASNQLEPEVRAWLSDTYTLTLQRYRHRNGYKADDLNKGLRSKMGAHISGVHGECYVESGTFRTRGKKGFDFAIFDEEYNIVRTRNLYVGDPGQFDGDEKLKKVYKTLGFTKRAWDNKIASLGGTNGIDLPENKKILTVVGELQFGNWALVKHDLLRLLNSSDSIPIDFYIYITATGSLDEKLSEGTVNYCKVIEALEENSRIINIPTWVIGIDEDQDPIIP